MEPQFEFIINIDDSFDFDPIASLYLPPGQYVWKINLIEDLDEDIIFLGSMKFLYSKVNANPLIAYQPPAKYTVTNEQQNGWHILESYENLSCIEVISHGEASFDPIIGLFGGGNLRPILVNDDMNDNTLDAGIRIIVPEILRQKNIDTPLYFSISNSAESIGGDYTVSMTVESDENPGECDQNDSSALRINYARQKAKGISKINSIR